MYITLEAGNALEVAAEQAATNTCERVINPETLSGTALLLYQALQATAVHAAAARNYVASTTHVTLHIPLEIVAQALGRHRVTVWRRLPELQARGLIDARAHKTTAPGCSAKSDTVNDGTLWCVRLNPDEGTPAKLTYDDLNHDGWRDLNRDRKRGRTAHRAVKEHREKQMQQSKDSPEEGFDLQLLFEWSLSPFAERDPVSNDCCMDERREERRDLEAVLDVQYADKEERGEAVDGAARALAANLGDSGSVMFYRWLLWQLLRLEAAGKAAPWHMVYEQARRARVDAAEGFARRPGALFTARLKGSPWWDEVKRAPPLRVGMRPMKV
jgi:hypothetical protein